MLYAMLIYETADAFANRNHEMDDGEYFGAWREFHKALTASGAYLGGEPLHPPETGTTVRVRDGRREIQDGPYANTKEQLAGFILLELDTLDAALDWAARCPASKYAAVEVRPVASAIKSKVACGIE